MVISSRTLEITVISGENLRVMEDPYVVVRAESLNCCTTKMVKDSGSNNSSFYAWNEKFMMNVPMYARSITFEVQCNKFKGVRPVGVARIAVSDFLNDAVAENCLQVLSYRLRDWEGKRNGVIHFAVRVAAWEKCSVSPTLVSGKDSGHQITGINVGDKKSDGVVVGVPFWWNYPNNII
ncbi:BON1-associated protein 2-like [Abrus precatorius]|uniref:BON1-associated protein 2-like n=1 Tax=Abrus precatorius TaxID=3816 RepID=A0A8B8K2N1_ABRPR|nr:BON1-associated protein 2-like [Abrus precatorius]